MSLWTASLEIVVGIFAAAFISALFAKRNLQGTLLFSVALLAGGVGMVRMEIASWPFQSSNIAPEGQVVITGSVTRAPEARESTTHIYLTTDTIDAAASKQTVLLYAPRNTSVKYGDSLLVEGELSVPETFTTDLGRTFDYPGYLRARGVSQVVFRPEITVVESGGSPFFSFLYAAKERFTVALYNTIPAPESALAAGLLLGERAGFSESLEEAFRRAGIIHIVVLSGYNVMLVVVFVTSILAMFLRPRARLIAGLIAIACFAIMVGLSATVVRASIMAALLLVAQHTGRHHAVMRALFFAAAVMVMINPHLLLFDPGFQLSFLATFGLLALSPYLEARFALVPDYLGLRSIAVASITTYLWVLPWLLYSIGEASIVGVLVNLLVLPLVPLAMLAAFLTGVVALIAPPLALFIGYGAYLILHFIILLGEWFGGLLIASFAVPQFEAWLVVLAYGCYLLVWYVHRQKGTSQEDGLASWTIETEEEPTKSAAPKGAAHETPVFFR